MYTENYDELRRIVNSHLGIESGEATKAKFEKAKSEIMVEKTAFSKAISLLTMEKYLEINRQGPEQTTAVQKRTAAMLDSYFIPLPNETIDGAFARAKREAVAKLKKEVSQIKVFSFKDYSFKRRKKSAAPKGRPTNFDYVRVEKKRTT